MALRKSFDDDMGNTLTAAHFSIERFCLIRIRGVFDHVEAGVVGHISRTAKRNGKSSVQRSSFGVVIPADVYQASPGSNPEDKIYNYLKTRVPTPGDGSIDLRDAVDETD